MSFYSNTKDISFGEGKGKIGERYPGERVKAGRIRDIDPSRCVEFSNVVLVCGTNDLRPENNPNLPDLIDTLISRVSEICILNSKANIILMPVLPTRDRVMNRIIMSFNRAVCRWIRTCHYNVSMPNVSSFLDNSDLLSSALTRNGDSIHLGKRGIAKFVSMIKQEIFRKFSLDRQQKSKPSRVGVKAPT